MSPNKNCRQNRNTQSSSIVFPENRAFFFLDNGEKYGRIKQAKDDHIILHRKDVIYNPDN